MRTTEIAGQALYGIGFAFSEFGPSITNGNLTILKIRVEDLGALLLALGLVVVVVVVVVAVIVELWNL